MILHTGSIFPNIGFGLQRVNLRNCLILFLLNPQIHFRKVIRLILVVLANVVERIFTPVETFFGRLVILFQLSIGGDQLSNRVILQFLNFSLADFK
jgi:hypothetical protein